MQLKIKLRNLAHGFLRASAKALGLPHDLPELDEVTPEQRAFILQKLRASTTKATTNHSGNAHQRRITRRKEDIQK